MVDIDFVLQVDDKGRRNVPESPMFLYQPPDSQYLLSSSIQRRISPALYLVGTAWRTTVRACVPDFGRGPAGVVGLRGGFSCAGLFAAAFSLPLGVRVSLSRACSFLGGLVLCSET